MKKALLVLGIAGILCCEASAATKYWDINNATPGAGGATPSGDWNTSTTNWTTDSNGTSLGTTWASGDAAIFSGGTDATGLFTITTTAAQTASSITVEEGTVRHAGTSTNKLTTSGLTINSGATFGVNVALSFTPTAGSVATLNGGTIQNYNPGSGGSFLTSSSANSNMKITLGTGGGHVSAAGGAGIITIYTGLIDGTGPLSIDGTGVFRLTTTPATYSGATIINGTLQMSTTANVLPSGTALTINAGGKYDLQTSQTVASLDGAGNLAATSSNQLTIGGTASTTYSGVWSGGRLNVNKSGGAGTLTLTGVNTSSGRFTNTLGTTTVALGASLCGPVADLQVDGGTLNLNNAAQTVENIAGAGGTINLNNASLSLTSDPIASTTYSGTITGAGGLTRKNANSTTRTLTLTGNNSYDGNTIIDKGIIAAGHANALGSTTGYTQVTATGAELLFTGQTQTNAEPLRIAGTGAGDSGAIAVISNSVVTLSGQVTLIGDATVTVSSNSALTLNNANSITSSANQNLTLQGGSGTGTGGVVSGIIDLGTGSLTKAQGGKWELKGANVYSGGTNVNAGTLLVNNTSGSGTGSGAVTVASGATLGGSGAIAGTVTSSGTISPGNSPGVLTIGGDLVLASGSYKYEINSNPTPTADLINVAGKFNITGAVALSASDLGSSVLAMGTKFTLINYGDTWNGGTFTGLPNYSTTLTIGANRFAIRYDDPAGGSNFGGGSVGLGSKFVTITAVPEASTFLTVGLGGIFAIASIWMSKRMGINVLKP